MTTLHLALSDIAYYLPLVCIFIFAVVGTHIIETRWNRWKATRKLRKADKETLKYVETHGFDRRSEQTERRTGDRRQ